MTVPNFVAALVLIAVLGGVTFAVWRFARQALRIVVIHNLVWAGAIVLVASGLIRYVDSSPAAWLTLLAGLIFFSVGCVGAAWLTARRRHPADDDESASVPEPAPLVTRRILLVLSAIYAAAFTVYLTSVSINYGLFTLLTSPSSIRAEPYLEAVPLPIRLLLHLGPLLFAVLGFRPAVRVPLPLAWRIVGMALLAVSMLALLQRTNLFMALLLLVALILTQPRDGSSKDNPATTSVRRTPAVRVVASVLAAALVALVAFQVLASGLRKQGSQAVSTGAVSEVLESSGLTSAFVYYTAGPVAFLRIADSTDDNWPPEASGRQLVVGNYNPQTWGLLTFSVPLRLIPGAPEWSNSPFVETPVLTNVYTWMEPLYRDFRVAGVIVGMALLGGILTVLYLKRYRSPRYYWLQAAILATVPLATFASKYNDPLFVFQVLAIVTLTAGSSLKRIRHRINRRRMTRSRCGETGLQ